jgi:hypothetical protein
MPRAKSAKKLVKIAKKLVKKLARQTRKPASKTPIPPSSDFLGFPPTILAYERFFQPVLVDEGRNAALVPLFKAPLRTLRQWKAIIIADEQAYENGRVSFIERDATEGRGSIRIEFAGMEATRALQVERMMVLDAEDRLIFNELPGVYMVAGDIFLPSACITI